MKSISMLCFFIYCFRSVMSLGFSQDCSLHPETVVYSWAMEQTGADLLRETLNAKSVNLDLHMDWVSVLDGNSEDYEHASYVSNLIAGPYLSSAIPSNRPITFFKTEEITQMEAYADGLNKKNILHIYVNNSMGWESGKIYDVYRKISNLGIHFIAASGNDYDRPIFKSAVSAAKKLNFFIVGATDEYGLHANYSQTSPSIIISAPGAGEKGSILTYSSEGKLEGFFYGTSAAAPQVTSALLAFSLITHYSPSKDEISSLLKTTAIKSTFSYDSPQTSGAGLLNTYKIGMLAFKAYESCHGQNKEDSDSYFKCVSALLLNPQFYQIEPESIENAKLIFAKCFNLPGPSRNISFSCEEQQRAFKQIRKYALLKQNEIGIWNALACIDNSLFYKTVARSQSKNLLEEESFVFELKNEFGMKDYQLMSQQFTKNYWPKHPEIVDEMYKEGGYDYYLAKYLLTLPEWGHRVDLVKGILKRGKFSDLIFKEVLPLEYWVNHPELIEQIMQDRTQIPNLVRNVLFGEHWTAYPNLIINIISLKSFDDLIDNDILSYPYWSNLPYFQKVLAGKKPTSKNLRKALKL